MVEKSQGSAAGEVADSAAPATVPAQTPRRGHRGMDPRETVAELTAKAHVISQSAGSKVAAAMKDVIGAAAGLTGFAVESARDLIHYMVRRGQMTPIEGEKLLREVEAAHGSRKPVTRVERETVGGTSRSAPRPEAPATPKAVAKEPAAAKEPAVAKEVRARPAKTPKKAAPVEAEKPAAKKAAAKPAAKKAAPNKGSASRTAPASRAKAAAKTTPAKKRK